MYVGMSKLRCVLPEPTFPPSAAGKTRFRLLDYPGQVRGTQLAAGCQALGRFSGVAWRSHRYARECGPAVRIECDGAWFFSRVCLLHWQHRRRPSLFCNLHQCCPPPPHLPLPRLLPPPRSQSPPSWCRRRLRQLLRRSSTGCGTRGHVHYRKLSGAAHTHGSGRSPPPPRRGRLPMWRNRPPQC